MDVFGPVTNRYSASKQLHVSFRVSVPRKQRIHVASESPRDSTMWTCNFEEKPF